MNINKLTKNEFYIIKVNKKISDNKLYNNHNHSSIQNNYKNKVINFEGNTPSKNITYSKNNNYNNTSPISHYQNQYNNNDHIKQFNSNSEKKNKIEKINIINRHSQFELKKNILKKEKSIKDINKVKNKKFSRLNIQTDDNLTNYKKKKNYSNISFNSFSNVDNNYNTRNLSIKTNDLNNNEAKNNKNYKTIEHRNINNYINEFQLINNYYDYDKDYELKNLNYKTYNKNIINYSTDRKKIKDYFYKETNPLLYYSFENNLNENNEDNHYKTDNNKINLPGRFYFKSNIFSKINNKNNINNYSFNKINKERYNNKNINKTDNNINLNYINNYKEEKINNIYIKCKSHYGNIGYNHYKYNRFDYNKKLFDIYRSKLIQEFIKHIKNVVKTHLIKFYKEFICYISKLNQIKINKDMFIKKINLNKTLKENKNNNLKNQKYIKIFNSERKYQQEKDFDTANKNNNNLKIAKIKINNNINQIINNNNISENYKRINNKLIYNNKKLKYIDNISYENINDNLRNSVKRKKLSSSNNINLIDINDTINNYIYKKKVKLSKNNTFINRFNKHYNTTNDNSKNNQTEINSILSNLKGKIIDIDINLGKPVKEINDISPLHGFLVNNYSSKNNCISFSTNKKYRHKKKHKSKNKKKLSLPKKKYLEKGYDNEPIDNDNENKIITEYRTNSYENRSNYHNNLIFLNNSMNIEKKILNQKKYSKKILVKNIVTSDRRLFIHINYIFYNNKNITKNNYYDINLLKVKKTEFFSLFNNFDIIKYKNKRFLSNNSLISAKYSRNYYNSFQNDSEKSKTNYTQNKKDKYLLSCIKFVIRIINKIFLKKSYIYFKKCIEDNLYKN